MRKIFQAVLCSLALGCTTIDPGEVGVEVSLGTIEPNVRTSGFHTVVIASIHKFSTRTQTYTMAGAGNEGDANGTRTVFVPGSMNPTVMLNQ